MSIPIRCFIYSTIFFRNPTKCSARRMLPGTASSRISSGISGFPLCSMVGGSSTPASLIPATRFWYSAESPCRGRIGMHAWKCTNAFLFHIENFASKGIHRHAIMNSEKWIIPESFSLSADFISATLEERRCIPLEEESKAFLSRITLKASIQTLSVQINSKWRWKEDRACVVFIFVTSACVCVIKDNNANSDGNGHWNGYNNSNNDTTLYTATINLCCEPRRKRLYCPIPSLWKPSSRSLGPVDTEGGKHGIHKHLLSIFWQCKCF